MPDMGSLYADRLGKVLFWGSKFWKEAATLLLATLATFSNFTYISLSHILGVSIILD